MRAFIAGFILFTGIISAQVLDQIDFNTIGGANIHYSEAIHMHDNLFMHVWFDSNEDVRANVFRIDPFGTIILNTNNYRFDDNDSDALTTHFVSTVRLDSNYAAVLWADPTPDAPALYDAIRLCVLKQSNGVMETRLVQSIIVDEEDNNKLGAYNVLLERNYHFLLAMYNKTSSGDTLFIWSYELENDTLIASSPADSLAFPYPFTYTMNSCHVGGGSFAVAGGGVGTDGFIYSIFMDGSGNLSVPETYEFLDNVTAYTMGMTSLPGSETVVNITNSVGSNTWVTTMEIDTTNGDIITPFLDQWQAAGISPASTNFVVSDLEYSKLDTVVVGLTGTASGYISWAFALKINLDGTIGAVKDTALVYDGIYTSDFYVQTGKVIRGAGNTLYGNYKNWVSSLVCFSNLGWPHLWNERDTGMWNDLEVLEIKSINKIE